MSLPYYASEDKRGTMKRSSIGYRKANPVQLARIVQTLVSDLGIGTDIFLKKVKENWQKIAGTTYAAKTHPVSLKNGILTVSVSSPAWQTQAQFDKPSFLKKIKDFEPQNDVEIHDIRFILEFTNRSTK